MPLAAAPDPPPGLPMFVGFGGSGGGAPRDAMVAGTESSFATLTSDREDSSPLSPSCAWVGE